MKNLLLFYACEDYFIKLKVDAWWARGLDSVYRLAVLLYITYFISLFVTTDTSTYELFDFFYSFVALTTVLAGGILGYYVLRSAVIYVVYGRKTIGSKTRSINEYAITHVVVYLLIVSTIWALMGP